MKPIFIECTSYGSPCLINASEIFKVCEFDDGANQTTHIISGNGNSQYIDEEYSEFIERLKAAR